MENRRDFLKTSAVFMGVLGTAGIAVNLYHIKNAEAQNVKLRKSSVIQRKNTVKLLKLDREKLGRLGNNLYESQAERQKFLLNPLGYAESFFGKKLDRSAEAKLRTFKESIADGFCCAGCGCGGAPVIDVKVRRY